jgi:hypothetical protein
MSTTMPQRPGGCSELNCASNRRATKEQSGAGREAGAHRGRPRAEARNASRTDPPAARSSTCLQEADLARYEHVQRHVIEARYLGDYKVWLEFNDGRKGVVDLADDLYGENFDVLRDRVRFADFYLDYGLATIAWDHGVDFAPDYLYEKLSAMH